MRALTKAELAKMRQNFAFHVFRGRMSADPGLLHRVGICVGVYVEDVSASTIVIRYMDQGLWLECSQPSLDHSWFLTQMAMAWCSFSKDRNKTEWEGLLLTGETGLCMENSTPQFKGAL